MLFEDNGFIAFLHSCNSSVSKSADNTGSLGAYVFIFFK